MKTTGSDYFRSIVLQNFEDRKVSFPRYSLRMFAKELGIQPAALSQFLKGSRTFSKKMFHQLATRLGLDPLVIEEVEKHYLEQCEASDKTTERIELAPELYYLLANPLYYSILSLIELDDFISDPSWMSRRLGFTVREIESAVTDLMKLGFLSRTKSGELKATSSNLASTDNIPNHSLRVRHQRNMLDAKDAVQTIPMEKRYFAFETLSFDKEDLPIVQKKINELMDDLILLSKRARKKTDVYEFCSQYFPRTKG